jgi:hypothetical protein
MEAPREKPLLFLQQMAMHHNWFDQNKHPEQASIRSED